MPALSLEPLPPQPSPSSPAKDQHATAALPERVTRISALFKRDPTVVRDVKKVEDNTCQVCSRRLTDARTGEPYSEIHHIQPLSHGGQDTSRNALCLCPLCHRLFHLGAVGVSADAQVLRSQSNNETLSRTLRIADNRGLDEDALRYHWDTFFAKPPDVLFCSKDDEDDLA